MSAPSKPDSRASIIGLGLIGGSVAKALRAAGWQVWGADADAEVEQRAVELDVIDAVGVPGECTITIVATPVDAIVDAVEQALDTRTKPDDGIER